MKLKYLRIPNKYNYKQSEINYKELDTHAYKLTKAEGSVT